MDTLKALLIGWYWPPNSRKAHCYDAEHRTLCGKGVVLAFPKDQVEPPDSPASPDDCAGCRRKLLKMSVTR